MRRNPLDAKMRQFFLMNKSVVVQLSCVQATKYEYVHIKSTTVYAPRRNWDSPNPFLASECSPPPRNRGEGAH
jgi:hypothetical protein